VHDRASRASLAGKYDAVNIKLDKTGGLTEALALKEAARGAGYRLMVGCMLGTSLAMAPALLVAQRARVVDLDGDEEGVLPHVPFRSAILALTRSGISVSMRKRSFFARSRRRRSIESAGAGAYESM